MVSNQKFCASERGAIYIIKNPLDDHAPDRLFVNESNETVILCSINGDYNTHEVRWVVRHSSHEASDQEAIKFFGLRRKDSELKVISEAEQKTILATIKQTVQNVYGVKVDKAYDMRKKAPRECKVVEAAFLAGCATILVPSGRCLPPAWDVCRMCGRSIFTLETFSKTEGAE